MSIRASLWRMGAISTCAAIALFSVATFQDRASANTLNVVGGTAPGLDIDLTITTAGGIATFLFQNSSTGGAAGSAVHEIYFEAGLASLLKTPATPDAPGTLNASLKPPASPDAPPGLKSGWLNLFGVAYDNQKGVGKSSDNMIAVGDAWAITFALVSNLTTPTDILNAIVNQSGNSRIALHIGDCVGSESCVATIAGDKGGSTSPVPLPGALVLFGSVIVGAVTAANIRRRRQRA